MNETRIAATIHRIRKRSLTVPDFIDRRLIETEKRRFGSPWMALFEKRKTKGR